MTKNDVCLLYTTLPSHEQAVDMGNRLVASRHIVCINIIPKILSIYTWEGALQQSEEHGVLLKTTVDQKDAAIAEVLKLHPYDTPAILCWTAETTPAFGEYVASWVCGG